MMCTGFTQIYRHHKLTYFEDQGNWINTGSKSSRFVCGCEKQEWAFPPVTFKFINFKSAPSGISLSHRNRYIFAYLVFKLCDQLLLSKSSSLTSANIPSASHPYLLRPTCLDLQMEWLVGNRGLTCIYARENSPILEWSSARFTFYPLSFFLSLSSYMEFLFTGRGRDSVHSNVIDTPKKKFRLEAR